MNRFLPFLAALSAAYLPLSAQYAPVPQDELGVPLVASIKIGAGYDDNLFLTAFDDEKVDSFFFEVAPTIKFNYSLTDQTFFNARYRLTGKFFEDRPTDDITVDHLLSAFISHLFTERTRLDANVSYQVLDNPEAVIGERDDGDLIFGQTERSFDTFTFAPSFSHRLTQLFQIGGSYSLTTIRYDEDFLAGQLDRDEHLLAAELAYILNERLNLVGEVRFREVDYKSGTLQPDFESYFVLVGFDYAISDRLEASGRAGVEQLERDFSNFFIPQFLVDGAGNTLRVTPEEEDDELNPYLELEATYAYQSRAEASLLVSYRTLTTSNPAEFPLKETFRTRASVRHPLTSRMTLGASLDLRWETLEGANRVVELGSFSGDDFVPIATVLETRAELQDFEYRFGLSLTYEPAENWALIADTSYVSRESSYEGGEPLPGDLSEAEARERERFLFTISARYTFGIDL